MNFILAFVAIIMAYYYRDGHLLFLKSLYWAISVASPGLLINKKYKKEREKEKFLWIIAALVLLLSLIVGLIQYKLDVEILPRIITTVTIVLLSFLTTWYYLKRTN